MKEIHSRKEIPAEYKWKLEDIYASDDAWEKEYQKLEEMLPALSALSETLVNDASSLANGLKNSK